MSIRTCFAASIVALAGTAAAAAPLTLELDGFGAGNKVLSADFDLDSSLNEAPNWSAAGYAALVPAGQGFTGDAVTELKGAEKTAARGLSLSRKSRVTFTFLGEEADFDNTFTVMAGGDTLFSSNGGTVFGESVTQVFDVGLIDFAYVTTGGASIANNGVAVGRDSLNIAYSTLFNDGRSAITFFGDSFGDSDNDDLGVRIDVAPIPLPAAGWMLLAGLGGLAALRRRAA